MPAAGTSTSSSRIVVSGSLRLPRRSLRSLRVSRSVRCPARCGPRGRGPGDGGCCGCRLAVLVVVAVAVLLVLAALVLVALVLAALVCAAVLVWSPLVGRCCGLWLRSLLRCPGRGPGHGPALSPSWSSRSWSLVVGALVAVRRSCFCVACVVCSACSSARLLCSARRRSACSPGALAGTAARGRVAPARRPARPRRPCRAGLPGGLHGGRVRLLGRSGCRSGRRSGRP